MFAAIACFAPILRYACRRHATPYATLADFVFARRVTPLTRLLLYARQCRIFVPPRAIAAYAMPPRCCFFSRATPDAAVASYAAAAALMPLPQRYFC